MYSWNNVESSQWTHYLQFPSSLCNQPLCDAGEVYGLINKLLSQEITL